MVEISLLLAQKHLRQKTTSVDTVRQNRRFLPTSAKITSGRAKGDSVRFYVKDVTLCSLWGKKNNPFVILSTQHGGQRNKEYGKPDIVEFYISTKSGVE